MALGEKKSVVMEEQMGVPGGVATLDEDGKLTQSQIPSMDFAEAGTKNTLDDGDAVAITDSTEDNATKRVLWSTVKSLLGNLFVPLTRTVNGKALSRDITLSASDVGARANTWTPTAGQVGAVPTTRKVNNKALSADVTLDAGDVGAAEAEHTHSADDITSGTLNTSRLPTIPVNKGGTGKTSWTANRLIYPSGSATFSQLAFPSSSGSVLRQGTSGGPYWTSIADLIAAMGAVRIKCGTYTGNGEYDSESSYTSVPQTINLGLKPKAVLVMSETGGMDSGSGRYYGGLVWDGSDLVVFLDTNYGDINAKVITLTNSGFTVYVQRVQMSSSSYRYIATNEDGQKYRYIVFY